MGQIQQNSQMDMVYDKITGGSQIMQADTQVADNGMDTLNHNSIWIWYS